MTAFTDRMRINLSTMILTMLTLIFGVRGTQIFPIRNPDLIPTITLFDILSFILLGVFISYSLIIGYNRLLLVLLTCSPLFGFVIIPFSLIYFPVYDPIRPFLIGLFLISASLIAVLVICWYKFQKELFAFYDSISSERVKKLSLKQYYWLLLLIISLLGIFPLLIVLVPFMIMSFFFQFLSADKSALSFFFLVLTSAVLAYLVISRLRSLGEHRSFWDPIVLRKPFLDVILVMSLITLVGLSLLAPRLLYNSIQYRYDSSPEIIEFYQNLEISDYFGDVPAFANDSWRGMGPNYLGFTERALLVQKILTSDYKISTEIIYSLSIPFWFSHETILDFAGPSFYYNYLYWNHSLIFLEDTLSTRLGTFTQPGENIHVIRETIYLKRPFMTISFNQVIAFFPNNNSISLILSGYRISVV
ncbi:MAG: hypothetical protein ACFFFG_04350 [Candidatus Thorarchaeota archaeon]